MDDFASSSLDEKLNRASIFRFPKFIKSSDPSESTLSTDPFKKRVWKQKQKVPLFEEVNIIGEVDTEKTFKERTVHKQKPEVQLFGVSIREVDKKAESLKKNTLQEGSEQNFASKFVCNVEKTHDSKKEVLVVEHEIDRVEDMEVDVQEIINEITSFRENLDLSHRSDRKQLCVDFDGNMQSVYYVTDTNVLLHDVSFLEKLKNKVVAGKPVIIVIPYVILQELDGLKKSLSVGKASRKAISWVNKYFERQDKRVVGQNYDDYLTTLAQNSKSVSTLNSVC